MRFDLPLCTGDDGKVYFGHDPAKLWHATQRAFDVVDRIDALINRRARRRSTMAQNYMTPKRTAEFAEIFRMFDKDGSGFLEVEELGAVLASMRRCYTDLQLQEAVDQVTGVKGSGGLTFEQFANLLRVNLSSTFEARMKKRFDVFDADCSGEVSLAEFTTCVQRLDGLVTTTEAAAMFKQCDRDGSGSISLQEFMEVVDRRFGTVEHLSVAKGAPPPVPVTVSPTFNTSIWEDKHEAMSVSVVELDMADPGTD